MDISMPGYIKHMLARFKHKVLMKRPQYSQCQPLPHRYWAGSKETLPVDTTANVNAERIKIVQQVISGVLYYACAITKAKGDLCTWEYTEQFTGFRKEESWLTSNSMRSYCLQVIMKSHTPLACGATSNHQYYVHWSGTLSALNTKVGNI